MWVLLGLGVLATACADATFAVQNAHGLADNRSYDFVWTMGALLLACAAWTTSSRTSRSRAEVTGLRAIALLLVAQALAAGIQFYALFGELGKSERVVTLVVLAVTSVQIVLARPRASPPAPHQGAGASQALMVRGAEPGERTGWSRSRRVRLT